ncbi:MAG TPA: alpha/beta hydrolase [Microbacteriaceae bacterium]|nr:alpha/beta hydrolase [Microbacteriaceae bacterium]
MDPTPDLADPRAEEGNHHETRIGAGVTHWWQYGPADAATTAIFVHGFRGDHHGLGRVAGQLQRTFPEPVRLVIPDLPGFGRSTAHGGALDLPAYARWLRGFTAAVAGETRVLLIGHSFGSVVAAAAVACDPEGRAPWRLALINPIGAPALAGPRRVGTALAVAYYQLAAHLPERAGFALLQNPAVVRVMSIAMAKTRDPALRRWIHDQHRRYFSLFESRHSLLQAFRASVENDVSMFAGRIAVPTLLIAADRDDITPLAAQRRLRTLFADARLAVIHGAGHLVHYEAPALAAWEIARFASSDGCPAAGSRP